MPFGIYFAGTLSGSRLAPAAGGLGRDDELRNHGHGLPMYQSPRPGRLFIRVIDFAPGGFASLNPPYKLHAWTAQNVGWIKAFGRIHQKL